MCLKAQKHNYNFYLMIYTYHLKACMVRLEFKGFTHISAHNRASGRTKFQSDRWFTLYITFLLPYIANIASISIFINDWMHMEVLSLSTKLFYSRQLVSQLAGYAYKGSSALGMKSVYCIDSLGCYQIPIKLLSSVMQ